MIPRDTEQRCELTPDDRRKAVARILAAGILRLRARPLVAGVPAGPPDPQKSVQTGQDCLDVSRKTVLSGHTS
jgi:hypothetical protein